VAQKAFIYVLETSPSRKRLITWIKSYLTTDWRRIYYKLGKMEKRLIILSLLMVLLFGTFALHSSDREGSQAKAADELASAPWPMEAHDPQHSGRSPYSGPEVPYLKWTYKTEGGIYHSPLIGADGTIYFGTDHSLYAIDADGALKWRYELEKEEFFCPYSPILGIDGTIYFGYYETVTTAEPGGIIGTHPGDGKLCALSPEGRFKWSYDCGIIEAPTIIGDDGTIYLSASISEGEFFNLYALTPDGSLKWRYEVEAWLDHFVLGHDGAIYFTLYNGKGSYSEELYALNPDGTFKRSYVMDGLVGYPVVGDDDTVYFCLWGDGEGTGSLNALRPDGSFKWRYNKYQEEGVFLGGQPAIAADGTVYIYGTYFKDGMGGQECFPLILALDPSGNVRWTCPLDSFLVATKPAVDREGTIYFCSGGKLCAINPEGTMAWTYQTGEELLYAPVIGSDGTIYFGSTEGTLYAIADLPQSPPPEAEFSIDIAEARAGEKVRFTNSSTGLITSLWWDFGDGVRLEQRDPTQGAEGKAYHTYLDEGSYTVSLIVSNPWGSGTMSKNINVVEYVVSQGDRISLWIWVVIGLAGALLGGIMIRRYLMAK
jgi:outer membrane protein assembly factor BamB